MTCRVISRIEGENELANLYKYTDEDSPEYARMVEEIRRELNFTTLKYQRLDDIISATGIEPCKLCTYCWTGKE